MPTTHPQGSHRHEGDTPTTVTNRYLAERARTAPDRATCAWHAANATTDALEAIVRDLHPFRHDCGARQHTAYSRELRARNTARKQADAATAAQIIEEAGR